MLSNYVRVSRINEPVLCKSTCTWYSFNFCQQFYLKEGECVLVLGTIDDGSAPTWTFGLASNGQVGWITGLHHGSRRI